MKTKNFTKILNPGTGRDGSIFIKITFTDGKLSLTGVEGPKSNGDATGSCGQIDMRYQHRNPDHDDKRTTSPVTPSQISFSDGWTIDMWLDLLETWHNWHLNDMEPGCEHQTGPDWDTQKQLELIKLTWGDEYHAQRKLAESGEMPLADFANWKSTVEAVNSLTISMNSPKHPSLWGSDGNSLLARGLIRVEKTETKTAGWTRPEEHPGGLLCKPCPVCGYKYGSAWRKVEVPQNILDHLKSLPETKVNPAWV